MKNCIHLLTLFAGLLVLTCGVAPAEDKIKVLLVGGQNNHNWAAMNPYIVKILTDAGMEVTEKNTPGKGAKKEDWEKWQPKFKDYDCTILNYNGQRWGDAYEKEFLDYVKNGGKVMILHAANNSFRGWDEFEKMVGLLWRPQKFGKSIYLDDAGKLVTEEAGQGRGMGHGGQYDWLMVTRDTEHPITKGMPKEWTHYKDELYHGQRGYPENVNIILTAYSDPKQRGTGKHEPMVWWSPYGKGKLLANLMGHSGETFKCVGFQTLLIRGCEWLATDKVASDLPANFPKDKAVVVDVLK